MPRSSGEQYKVGRKILPSQALPGDLIFWGPEGTQSVALFIGNGQMVESTPPAVVVSPVRTDEHGAVPGPGSSSGNQPTATLVDRCRARPLTDCAAWHR